VKKITILVLLNAALITGGWPGTTLSADNCRQ